MKDKSIDLNKIDLENLTNVDKRLIPMVKKYFERIMQLDENPLDYRIETIYNELLSGNLRIIVGSDDQKSEDYNDNVTKYCSGIFVNEDKEDDKTVSSVIINKRVLNYLDEIDDAEYMSVLSHEMEHFISFRFNNKENNTLINYSIIGEAATEIGNLYNLFNGDENKVKECIFDRDSKVGVAYRTSVILLSFCNKAKGNRIVDIINANRNNDMEFFDSIIPHHLIESLSMAYSNFFEGKKIDEIGDGSARVLYESVKALENYMSINYLEYPYMDEMDSIRLESIFYGYEDLLEEKQEVEFQLDNNLVYDLDSLTLEKLKYIEDELRIKFPDLTPEKIKYSILSSLLTENPNNVKLNSAMSVYSGYIMFLENVKICDEFDSNDVIIKDNLDDYINQYRYENGLLVKQDGIKPRQLIICRDRKKGIVRCFINGKEVSNDEYCGIIIEDDSGKNVKEYNLVGKSVDDDVWEEIQNAFFNQDYYSDFVRKDEMMEKLESFDDGLYYYLDLLPAKKSQNNFFIDHFELNEPEFDYIEDKISVLARNALDGENFATYESVEMADREYQKRIDKEEKDEGELEW